MHNSHLRSHNARPPFVAQKQGPLNFSYTQQADFNNNSYQDLQFQLIGTKLESVKLQSQMILNQLQIYQQATGMSNLGYMGPQPINHTLYLPTPYITLPWWTYSSMPQTPFLPPNYITHGLHHQQQPPRYTTPGVHPQHPGARRADYMATIRHMPDQSNAQNVKSSWQEVVTPTTSNIEKSEKPKLSSPDEKPTEPLITVISTSDVKDSHNVSHKSKSQAEQIPHMPKVHAAEDDCLDHSQIRKMPP